MKVCFSSIGKDLGSSLDTRFGRCQHFIVVDTETGDYKVVDNDGQISPHGAGISAAQQVIKENVDVIITGNLGPNSMRLLEGSDIQLLRGKNGTIQSNLESFKDDKLEKITEAGPSHFGLGSQHRHRGR